MAETRLTDHNNLSGPHMQKGSQFFGSEIHRETLGLHLASQMSKTQALVRPGTLGLRWPPGSVTLWQDQVLRLQNWVPGLLLTISSYQPFSVLVPGLLQLQSQQQKVSPETFSCCSDLLFLFSHSVVSNSFATPWTVAHQAPPSLEFPR